jgi:hypothetical protein
MKLTRTIYFSALALFTISQGVQTAYAGDDLVFVAVDPPCRIVNTRATGTPSIPADGSTDFLGFGDAGDLDSQGAVFVNVVVVSIDHAALDSCSFSA